MDLAWVWREESGERLEAALVEAIVAHQETKRRHLIRWERPGG